MVKMVETVSTGTLVCPVAMVVMAAMAMMAETEPQVPKETKATQDLRVHLALQDLVVPRATKVILALRGLVVPRARKVLEARRALTARMDFKVLGVFLVSTVKMVRAALLEPLEILVGMDRLGPRATRAGPANLVPLAQLATEGRQVKTEEMASKVLGGSQELPEHPVPLESEDPEASPETMEKMARMVHPAPLGLWALMEPSVQEV